ncbi:fungal-specific transcription factor domain-containing protein [Tricharina praecox]|uniref:fungal-specific transcription factor domain-containing protein n=1 Tax=Tricharina praecox TaxID=43433 RepID=UPI00221EEDD7|nr:fungal-specific transcription factor domain-containing protein [Tricharina praecox]KAI5847580.1 fungal-specific transcription factor domain-containing protein [Tricharina praecox]
MQNINPIPNANGPGPSPGHKKATATIDSPAKNMRSSIACVRCRRSKVKCVNTGPNTTCRACEASNRECTYPQPVASGAPRASGGSGGATMSIGSVAGAGSGGLGGAGGAERVEAPKKAKPKKPTSSANAAATAASMNTPSSWKECLGAPVLTQAVWQLIFDAFQLHHSPVLPFLHPPTFLNRLRASTANPGSSSGNSPPPEKPHSPLLLLGMLTLTGRHIAPLVSHHAPALATPTAVSEFYASALKYRLKNEDDDSLLVPSLDKVQALVMLSIHEWGQTRKSEAYMWLGLAIRMTGALGLSWVDADDAPATAPYSPQPESDDPLPFKRRKLDNGTSASAKAATAYTVEKEIRRRTFWAVFVLDRSLSSGRYFPSGIPSADADRVQLPSDERGFMFGADTKTGFLNSDSLLHPGRSDESHEIGAGERILAHVVKAMELWGHIQSWTETVDSAPPSSRNSEYARLSAALDAFVESLPHQLEYSENTLQVHFSTRSSSSYAVLHIALFLCRITLERKCLPNIPFHSPHPLGPVEPTKPISSEEERFYSDSAERYLASARDLVTLVSSLQEWNSRIESPFIILALERAARSGLYVYNFPWMDIRGYMTGVSRIHGAEPMGSGEETRKAVEFIQSLKPRWAVAGESFAGLVNMQTCVAEQLGEFIRNDDNGSALEERTRLVKPNQDERTRLFSLLAPPTPKAGPIPVPSSSQGRGPSSEVDTLLLAANQEPVVASGSERWMAVNTPIPAAVVQPQAPPPTVVLKTEEGGSLDALAGFAAQQGKIGNGQEYNSRDRDVEMGEAGIKKEESSTKSGEERRWIDNGVKPSGNWGAVSALES